MGSVLWDCPADSSLEISTGSLIKFRSALALHSPKNSHLFLHDYPGGARKQVAGAQAVGIVGSREPTPTIPTSQPDIARSADGPVNVVERLHTKSPGRGSMSQSRDPISAVSAQPARFSRLDHTSLRHLSCAQHRSPRVASSIACHKHATGAISRRHEKDVVTVLGRTSEHLPQLGSDPSREDLPGLSSLPQRSDRATPQKQSNLKK
jgi:hypothetical protein